MKRYAASTLLVVLLSGLIFVNPIFALPEARADVGGLISQTSCPELDAIQAALSDTGTVKEFDALRAYVTAKSAEFSASNTIPNVNLHEIVHGATGVLGGVGSIVDTDVPVHVTQDSAAMGKFQENNLDLAARTLQSAQTIQKTTGDTKCVTILNDVLDMMDRIATTSVTAKNQATGVGTILSFLESLGGTVLSLSGGSPNLGQSATGVTDVVNAKKNLLGVNMALTVYKKELDILNKAGSNSLLTANALAARKAKLDATIAQLNTKQDQLQQLSKATWVDYLKAFAVSTGQQAILSLANNVIPKMIQTFGIQDYYKLGNAIANQVYAIDFIKQNYSGNEENAMIVKSIYDAYYNNQPAKFRTAQAAIQQQAATYGGPACAGGSAVDLNDPDFLFNMQRCGTTGANPLFISTERQQAANAARQSAMNSAQLELLQSQGANSIRPQVAGAQQQQSEIDAKNAQLVAQASIAKEAYETLARGKASAEELARAKAAWDAAEKSKTDLYVNTPDGTVKTIFQAVTTPGPFIAKFVTDKGLSTMINTDNLNPENLPSSILGFSKMFGDMITKWVMGDKVNAGSLLKETGIAALSPGITAITTAIANSGNGGLTPGPNTNGMLTATNNVNGSVTIAWNLTNHPDAAKVGHIELSGLGKSSTSRQAFTTSTSLTGSYTVTLTEDTNIEIALFDKNNQAFTSFTIWAYPGSSATDSCPVPGTCGSGGNTGYRGSNGAVAGASTFLIRGPALSIR